MGGLNVGEVGPLSGSLRELMEVEDLARSWVWRELLRERDNETGNEEEKNYIHLQSKSIYNFNI